jgi:hypothetical protein
LNKYTIEELRSMAREFVTAHRAGDIRALAVLQLLSDRTGYSIAQCQTAIENLAND